MVASAKKEHIRGKFANDDVESVWNALEQSAKEAAKRHLRVTKPSRSYIDKMT